MLFQCYYFQSWMATYYLCKIMTHVAPQVPSPSFPAPILQLLPAIGPPWYHAAPCQQFPSVSGMPWAQSSNQTRLLRIDMLPPLLPPPASSVTLPQPGRGWGSVKQERLKTPGINSSHQAQLLPDSFSPPRPQIFLTGGKGGGGH